MTEKWVLTALAQGSLITSSQLAECGVSRYVMAQLLSTGQLHRVARGVYRLSASGEPVSVLWLKLLQAGHGAFACRRSAAVLWRLDGLDRLDQTDVAEVAVAGTRHPRCAETIRLSHIRPEDLVVVRGFPATSVVRTLIDLGAVVPASIVERAVESAVREAHASVDEIEKSAEASHAIGSSVLRSVLAARPAGAVPTESDAETIFLQLTRMAGLPDPERQVGVFVRGKRYRLDFGWRPIKLAVEIDGASVHGAGQLTADLRRQNYIQLDGWLVIRFTWAMVTYEPASVRRDLLAAWRLRTLECHNSTGA